MTAATGVPAHASPADLDTYGPDSPGRPYTPVGGTRRPSQDRVTADGSSGSRPAGGPAPSFPGTGPERIAAEPAGTGRDAPHRRGRRS